MASFVADRFLDQLSTTPSAAMVAAMHHEAKGDYHPPKLVPPSGSTVQHRQRGNEKRDSRKDYTRNKSKKKREMSKRHEKLMRYRKFKDYKSWYNEQYREKGKGFRRRSDEWQEVDVSAEGITFNFTQESPTQDTNYVPTSPRDLDDDGKTRPRTPGQGGPEKHLDDADSGTVRIDPHPIKSQSAHLTHYQFDYRLFLSTKAGFF